MSEISINHQTYGDDNGEHKGKLFLSPEGGRTGYVEWNTGYRSKPERNTARLEVTGRVLAIEIPTGVQKKGIGKNLLNVAIQEARGDGYDRLLILGVPEKARGFYDTALGALEKEGDVFVNERKRRPEAGGDYEYEVLLNKK